MKCSFYNITFNIFTTIIFKSKTDKVINVKISWQQNRLANFFLSFPSLFVLKKLRFKLNCQTECFFIIRVSTLNQILMLKLVTIICTAFCVVGEDDTPLAAAEVVEIACWVFYGFLCLLLSDLGPGHCSFSPCIACEVSL